MSSIQRVLQVVPGIAVAALAVGLGVPGSAVAAGSAGGAETTYYISLGDSLATGYQPDVDKDTSVAYTDQLYKQLKQREPGLEHIRLGCTGETTESLIKGGKCDYPGATSQLDAALKAMAEHNGKVAYVTIDIGANDIRACVSATGSIDSACLSKAGQSIASNLGQITGALSKAGSKGTQFAGATYYNPVLAAWLLGDAGQKSAKESASLVSAANSAISQVYAATGFKAADVAGAFSSDDFDHLVNVPGYGEVPTNVAKICQLTWACTKQDPHPNAAGHKVIADAFAAVLPASGTTPQPGGGASPEPSDAASASASPTGTASPGSDPSTGANQPKANGGLAATGSSSSTPVIAGSALAAVALGAGVLFAVRKRRTAGQE
ncbi:GDSL-type esterase/lipase family protein [Streptomyces sp. NPDC047072]|uniref:GDSL-type esterase/lipase family protein n=1 Tax=Streptomyces sp. NPDC047072 TaxID=3154809 RepID=UPI00340FD30B